MTQWLWNFRKKITYVWRGPKFHVLARYWFPLVQVTEVLPCWWHCPEMSWRIACRMQERCRWITCLLEHSSCSLDKTAQQIDARQSSRINPMVHSRYCWAQAQKFSGTVSVPLKSASALKRCISSFEREELQDAMIQSIERSMYSHQKPVVVTESTIDKSWRSLDLNMESEGTSLFHTWWICISHISPRYMTGGSGIVR